MTLYDTNFTQWDWGIVVLYLLGSIAIGLWANRYVGNLSDYLVAGRTLRIRLALATMTGTELGLVTVMYSSELGYTKQFASLYLAVMEAMVLLLAGLTGFIIYRLRATAVLTIPEYYERRYSRGVRILGACLMVVSGVLNMGLFLKAGSQFLTAIAGLENSLYLKWIMTALLLLVLFYTVLGGMISVVITDLVQFLILGFGMLIVTGFVIGTIGLDGFSAVVTESNAYFDPTNPDNPAHPESTEDGIGPQMMLAQAAVIFTAILLWPASASRTLSVKSSKVAQQLYLLSAIPFLARRGLPVLWGIGAFAFFASNPALHAEFTAAVNDSANPISTLSAMPLFLAKIIPSGLLGLVTAGMVAAFMSTHDSYLLCWSGVITQDVVAPIVGPLTDKTRIAVTRTSIVLIGAALLIWGLWYEVSTDLWDYMAVTGTVYLAGVFPVVAGGLYWKRGSTFGAYAALLGGVTGLLAMQPAIAFLNRMAASLQLDTRVNNAQMMLFTFTVSLVGYIVGSLLVPDRRPLAAQFAGDRPDDDASHRDASL